MKQSDKKPRNLSDKSFTDNDHLRITTPNSEKAMPAKKTTLQDLHSLIMNETRLKQIIENIDQVLWLRDVNSGRILYVSPAFETVWGRPCESLYTNPEILIESVHPEDRVQVLVASSHDDHKPIDLVYRILRLDGIVRWISARTFLINDYLGAPHGQFCIAQDITDQKMVEITQHKTLELIREQFDLSHKMSLARKPELVLKTLMSAHELRPPGVHLYFFSMLPMVT